MAIAFIRTIILYLLLTVGIRIMGKKQVGELETVELVFTMLISDLAAVPMQDFGIPLAYGLIPILWPPNDGRSTPLPRGGSSHRPPR